MERSLMRSKNPLFRRFSRLNELQIVDMALSELEQNIHLPREDSLAMLRRIGVAMEKKWNQIPTAPHDQEAISRIIRRALCPDPLEGYSCTADMILDLHRARVHVEQAMTQRLAKEEKDCNEVGQTPDKPRKRPFCERALKPLTVTLCLLLTAGLAAGGGIALHYLYPNGVFLTPVEVPMLVGQNLNTAAIDSDLFIPQVTYQYHRDSEVGTILSQSPQAGMTRRVAVGRHPCTLTLVVSLGAEQVQLGDYAGMTQYQALTACRRLGLIPSIERVSNHPAGNVAKTVPEAGTVLSEGSTVTLYVGTANHMAKVAVPNLIGNSEVGASTILSSLGLMRGTISYMVSDQPAGTVIAQSVLSGTTVNAGSKVSLVVSQGKK